LVADDDEAEPGAPEPSQRLGGAVEQPDPGRVARVADVLDQRAVAVEENRRVAPAAI